MIHQALGSAHGQASYVEIQYKELNYWKDTLTQIYAEHTKTEYEKLIKDMDRDNFMNAKEAIDYGLADTIIKHR